MGRTPVKIIPMVKTHVSQFFLYDNKTFIKLKTSIVQNKKITGIP